jgi:hypothetical protein
MKKPILLMLGLAVVWVVPVFAHHSFAAEFDAAKPITLRGTVTKFDLINPHGWIYLEGEDENGKTGKWAVETGNVSSLLRRGWTKDSLKPGTEVIIQGSRAKDGSNTVNAREVKLPDGRKLFAGSSEGDAPAK